MTRKFSCEVAPLGEQGPTFVVVDFEQFCSERDSRCIVVRLCFVSSDKLVVVALLLWQPPRGWTKGIPKKDENKLSSIKWKKHFQGAASNSSPARREELLAWNCIN